MVVVIHEGSPNILMIGTPRFRMVPLILGNSPSKGLDQHDLGSTRRGVAWAGGLAFTESLLVTEFFQKARWKISRGLPCMVRQR